MAATICEERISRADSCESGDDRADVAIAERLGRNLQEEDTLHARKHGYARHSDPQPLYTTEDVDPVFQADEEGGADWGV